VLGLPLSAEILAALQRTTLSTPSKKQNNAMR
jgi:hypothetical protein